MNEAEIYLKKLNYLESRIAFLERLERGFVEERGWIPIFQTAVYASATSVTFANVDLTAYLKIGVKCSWYQSSGWRYGYVLSSSYGSGNTTLNFVANTSFNVANTAISTFRISYGSPPDFPGWFGYTTILSTSSGAFSNATSSGKFSIHGKTCEINDSIAVVVNGTAVGIKVSVPFLSVGGFTFTGRENQSTGVLLQGFLPNGSGVVSIYNYAQANINADNLTIYLNGLYSIA